MTLEMTRYALLWCSIINYVILGLWFCLSYFAHDWMQRLYARKYQVTAEQFGILNVAGMMGYKLAIILLNIVPCAVLYLVA